MSDTLRPRRRRWPWIVLVAGVVLASVALMRRPLVAAALTSVLQRAGAAGVQLDVTQASPWSVEVQDMGFNFQQQRFDVRSVKVSRAHWWQRSLGAVQVSGARMPVALDGSAPPPWALFEGDGGGGGQATPSAGQPIPAEAISFDGVFVLQFPDAPAEELHVEFGATLGENFKWSGTLSAKAPGLLAEVKGSYDFPQGAVQATITESHLDLTRWENLLQQFVPMPAGVWLEAGTVTATAELHAKVGAKPGEDFKVWGTVHANAPGLVAEITGSYDAPSDVAQFEVTRLQLDLARWQTVAQKLAPLPGGVWQMAGTVTATATCTYATEQVSARAQVQLREGRFVHPEGMPVASGVTADFIFTDALALISEPGVVRVREIDAGDIKATNFEAEIALAGADELRVSRVTMEAMGGRVAVEPFVLFPQRDAIEATLLVEGLVVEQLLALTKDLPAKATGRVDGRLPVHYSSSGVRLGTGWLELKRGAPAELQFNSHGLLTAGVAPKHPSYATLKKIETGLLRLNLTELRLDIRPPHSPAGRSATLRVAGVPVDPELKAPVNLDLNVNGPIEQLLNLGMDGRIKFATGR